MYISKFCAINYRSLKQVVIRLEPGRNVIVGKNNSGKSNIIKGIEILVGEKFPTYQNFTDNDFFTQELADEKTGEISESIADNLFLEVELTGRDFNETVIKSIKKKTAFSKVKSTKCLYTKDASNVIHINFDLFQNLDDIEEQKEIEVLERYSSGKEKKTEWKTSDDILVFLKDAKTIKLFFCKSRTEEEKCGFGLICIDQSDEIWMSHFLSKKLRDSLITSTVISSLRSQKEDLRIVHYTWFGKLIEGLWQRNKSLQDPISHKPYDELIKGKTVDIKQLVDAVFRHETEDIRNLLSGAIAHKSISFKFLNDTKNELFKNIEIFVNDGIDRPLHEKGTGIQSAIIIALFSLYCNNFHSNSSLLIAEEPELYLHPQAKRVISSELDKFIYDSAGTERQLIISTHSTEFLKNVEPYNIIRVTKIDQENCTVAQQIDKVTFGSLDTELKRFLWSNNTELFFADKVVLVEGGEVFLIPSIVDKLLKKNQVLDYENISVTRINGKGSFLGYVKMLKCFNIEYLIVGDLDCFEDEVEKLVTYLKLDSIKSEIKLVKDSLSEMDVDYVGIKDRVKGIPQNLDANLLESVFNKIANKTINAEDEELNSVIKYMESRHKKGIKEGYILKKMSKEEYQRLHHNLRSNRIFIWSKGDLETYYTETAKSVIGTKDTRALNISYILKDPTSKIEDYFLYADEIEELSKYVLAK